MLHTSVDLLPRTSGLTKKRLHALSINTYEDLLRTPPIRYEDYSHKITASQLPQFDQQKCTVEGEIVSVMPIQTRSRITLQKVRIRDRDGFVEISFFNQPYILTQLKRGMNVAFSGTVKQFGSKYTLQPETFEAVGPGIPRIQTGRILPIYSQAKGLTSRLLREKITNILIAAKQIDESLPTEMLASHELLPLSETFFTLHRPENGERLQQAKRRLSFEELFTLQLSTKLIKKQWKDITLTEQLHFPATFEKKIEESIKSLPFDLTADQRNAVRDILKDLKKEIPMNRFLQGDVGSGKTVVAAIAAYAVFLAGKKTLYMAPTEILAQQHAKTFEKILSPLGVSVGLETGSHKDSKKKKQYDIVIGTHALLSSSFSAEGVAFVIVDEQHRFGVKQRARLRQKGLTPHLLTMTATPIPRTVALTAFGELDMSVLSTTLPGRKPIKTFVIPQAKRKDAYEWIKKEIREKKIQVFIICPLVDESESETMQSVKAVKKEYESLQAIFPAFSLGLLHGKMKSKEKEQVMADFAANKISILISTSVVEVGIDIPNATVMIIEGAERFGLAQLHQLRGRIGRGTEQSYCYLFSSTPQSSARLSFFAKTHRGIQLAEYDLQERGPGNMYGFDQHGFMNMRFASFSDPKLIEETQHAANHFIDTYSLDDYPYLKQNINVIQREDVSKD